MKRSQIVIKGDIYVEDNFGEIFISFELFKDIEIITILGFHNIICLYIKITIEKLNITLSSDRANQLKNIVVQYCVIRPSYCYRFRQCFFIKIYLKTVYITNCK